MGAVIAKSLSSNGGQSGKVLAGAAVTPLGPIEIGIFLGFAGLFFLAFLAFARVFPGALPVQAE